MRTCKRPSCSESITRTDLRVLYCSHRCRKAMWDEEVIGACTDCAKDLRRAGQRRGGSGLCAGCFNARKARAFAARAQIIADLWEGGMSRKEIGAEFGWTDNRVSVEFDLIRRRFPGLLPYRYTLKNPRAQQAAA